MLKKLAIYSAMLFLPIAAYAASATLNPAGGSPQTVGPVTSSVTVTIPAVVSIDVESNLTFDFGNVAYHTPASATDCTDAFPPGADCTTVTYSPSSVTIPGSGTAGQIWLAIFSNKAGVQATMKVNAFGDAAFSVDPGFLPQAIKLAKGTTNSGPNGAVYGVASPGSFIGTAGTPLDLTVTAPTSSVFGWTRIDQTPTLVLPGSQTFNVVTGSTANISFTLSY